mgnify:CR=1 FL=1
MISDNRKGIDPLQVLGTAAFELTTDQADRAEPINRSTDPVSR